MQALLKLAAGAAFAMLTAQAQAVDFSFLSGNPAPEAYGNSYSLTVDGLTMTATAWSTTGSHGRYQSAELEIYPGYGMGVCNRDEGLNCSSTKNKHALDNNGPDDLILFAFSSAVQLDTLELLQFGGDSDLIVWAGTGTLDPDGLKPDNLGSAITINNTLGSNTTRIYDLNTLFGNAYTWLAVSALVGASNDYVKLQSLAVAPVSAPVPEAETWAMLLAGLGMIGFAVRRRV